MAPASARLTGSAGGEAASPQRSDNSPGKQIESTIDICVHCIELPRDYGWGPVRILRGHLEAGRLPRDGDPVSPSHILLLLPAIPCSGNGDVPAGRETSSRPSRESRRASRSKPVSAVLPCCGALAPLLPGGGLAKGSVVAVESAGAALPGADGRGRHRQGMWCGVAGMPRPRDRRRGGGRCRAGPDDARPGARPAVGGGGRDHAGCLRGRAAATTRARPCPGPAAPGNRRAQERRCADRRRDVGRRAGLAARHPAAVGRHRRRVRAAPRPARRGRPPRDAARWSGHAAHGSGCRARTARSPPRPGPQTATPGHRGWHLARAGRQRDKNRPISPDRCSPGSLHNGIWAGYPPAPGARPARCAAASAGNCGSAPATGPLSPTCTSAAMTCSSPLRTAPTYRARYVDAIRCRKPGPSALRIKTNPAEINVAPAARPHGLPAGLTSFDSPDSQPLIWAL